MATNGGWQSVQMDQKVVFHVHIWESLADTEYHSNGIVLMSCTRHATKLLLKLFMGLFFKLFEMM